MREQFAGERLKPSTATSDTSLMAAGGPGLPMEFLRGKEVVRIQTVIRSWKETGKCTHGSGENYTRKHWFEVETSTERMKIYFERKARGGPCGARWWLYSTIIDEPITQTPERAESTSR